MGLRRPAPQLPGTPPGPVATDPLSGVVQGPYGYADAIITMSSVAAPLLAGFSITCMTLVVQGYERLRYPGLTLTLLSVASVLLLMTVQYGFWARRWWWGTLGGVLDAWPDGGEDARKTAVQEELVDHYTAFAV
jgi:hypothetical protein